MDSKQTASFVWAGPPSTARSQFVLCTRDFEIGTVPDSMPLHLFADTRYELCLDGELLGVGPARFVTGHPEYDTVELAGHLSPGRHRLEVLVNFYGASSYQTMPDGRPGFIAWGGADGVDFGTPGEWRGRKMAAWSGEGPAYSFAQGPVEVRDLRLGDAGEEAPLVRLEGEDKPWGEPEPCSAPALPLDPHLPKRIAVAGPLRSDRYILGFSTAEARGRRITKSGDGEEHGGFATWVWSPREQAVRMDCCWTDLWLNGEALDRETGTDLGNHEYATASLRRGWNVLSGRFCVVTNYPDNWVVQLGFPKSAGLKVCARAEADAEPGIAVSPLRGSPPAEADLPGADAVAAPEGWTILPGTRADLSPGRQMAWDEPSESMVRDLPMDRLTECGELKGVEATWCFQFAGAFLGHVEFDVEAPEGTVMDVGTDDWQREDGFLGLYRANPFVDSADRYILKGGRQTVRTFHARGGKVLQITMRSPDGGEAVFRLHGVVSRSRLTMGWNRTEFRCGDAVMERAWVDSFRTFDVSTDDSYSDCPWRERGTYIGDSWVNQQLHFLSSSDLRLPRRILRVFAQAQREDGLLPGVAPAWLRETLADYSLIWMIGLRDFVKWSGEMELVRELWPALERIWSSPAWETDPETGLWNGDNVRTFVDWGVLRRDKEGRSNAVLNFFRVGAAKASGDLARMTDRADEAAKYDAEAERVEAALLEHLWDEGKGRFKASAVDDQSLARHANALALAFEVGPESRRRELLARMEPELRDNCAYALEHSFGSGYLDLYFLAFLLPALAQLGRPDLAEAMIRSHYGYIQEMGEDTLPEGIVALKRAGGSRCHAWGGAAAVYSARFVLGLERLGPDRFRFQPTAVGPDAAEGRIVQGDGWVRVSWKREAEGIRYLIEAPADTRIEGAEPAGPGRWAGVLSESGTAAGASSHMAGDR